MSNSIFNNKFSRNVLTLMTGTIIAQAIPIVVTPILTRLYTPEDFGLLAIFSSITIVISSIATGRYELAIVIPESDHDAVNIAALGMLINTLFSFVLIVPFCIFNTEVTMLISNSNSISVWLYLVPIIVWFIGAFNILNFMATRKRLYKEISSANIYKSIISAMLQITIGILRKDASGLIIGQISLFITSNYRLLQGVKEKYNISSISLPEIKRLSVKYDKFPKYSMFAGLANTSSMQITNILIAGIFGVSTLGLYSFTQKILGVPANLVSRAIGQVFFEEASREKRDTGSVENTFKQTLKKLLLIGIPVFSFLYFIIEDAFAYFFGENWVAAGVYAKILIPLFFMKFCASPLMTMNMIFNKNEVGLYWQLGLLFIYLVSAFVGYYEGLEFEDFLLLLTVAGSLHYMLIIYIVSKYETQSS